MTSSEIDTELKSKLLDSLKFVNGELSEGYAAGKAFVIEQAPIVVQEMLRWAIFDRLFFAAIEFSIIVSWLVGIYIIRKKFDRHYLHQDAVQMYLTFGGITSLICLVNGLGQIWQLAQVIIAPRLFLIEQAKDLLK